jgi:hypothetical protein
VGVVGVVGVVGAGVVGVVVVAPAAAWVAASDGPSGTPFEQAASDTTVAAATTKPTVVERDARII